MGLVVEHKGMLLKINNEKKCIEYSKNEGKGWHFHGSMNSDHGDFLDLVATGGEVLAITTKGTYYSRNDGKSWHKK